MAAETQRLAQICMNADHGHVVKLLTDESDIILDFFAGSNTTGFVAETLHRRWLALENVEDYLKASKFRFDSLKD